MPNPQRFTGSRHVLGPAGSGRWEDIQYVTKPDHRPVSAWVVYDNLQQPLTQVCPPRNTLLITGEPECLRRYRTRFTSQFGQVWTSHPSIRHHVLTQHHEAQHWHYAMRPGMIHGKQLGFEELRDLPRPPKTKRLSVICSSKANSDDHRRRLEFVRRLQTEFGEEVDVFGRGIRSMEDKSEAIYEYKYHIVLENDHSQYFMTEKLADAFLGWSYPIYFGGPEANRRFPEGSFAPINIYRPEQALSTIRTIIEEQTYERRLEQIAMARNAVLFKNNMFALLANYWRDHLFQGKAQPLRLLPKNHRAGLLWRQMGRTISKPFDRQAA